MMKDSLMSDRLEEFIQCYGAVLSKVNQQIGSEHATPENIREITFYLLQQKARSERRVLQETGKPAEIGSAYTPWTLDLDQQLREDYANDQSLENLAIKYHRTRGAIRSRLEKLGLRQPESAPDRINR
jgi:hypothetical protein